MHIIKKMHDQKNAWSEENALNVLISQFSTHIFGLGSNTISPIMKKRQWQHNVLCKVIAIIKNSHRSFNTKIANCNSSISWVIYYTYRKIFKQTILTHIISRQETCTIRRRNALSAKSFYILFHYFQENIKNSLRLVRQA